VEPELSEDQDFFLATTRRFLAAEAPIATVRALEDDPAGFAADYWRQGAGLGWTSLLVAEEHGGGSVAEHGLADLVLVAEEMGRRVAPGPLSPVNLVASAVAAAGGPVQRLALLPGLLSGEAVAAWTGPGLIPAAAADEGEGDGDGDGWVLSGVAVPVEAGAQAAVLLVAAQAPEGPTLLLVEPDLPGVEVVPLAGLDLVRRYAEVRFDGARVPAAAAVGEPGGAAAEIERLWHVACVLQCAEMVGVMERVFEMTLEYLGDRYSFGRPLSSYQALKHRIADQKTWLEASHAAATAAARAVAHGTHDAAELVSAAKVWIGPHATELVQECIQLHGGIGVTWEHDLHLFLRRATVDRLTYGTPEDHAERIAVGLLGEAS
jgi:alkylation response protein AidB-like acyl-CoA dehydrogenase